MREPSVTVKDNNNIGDTVTNSLFTFQTNFVGKTEKDVELELDSLIKLLEGFFIFLFQLVNY